MNARALVVIAAIGALSIAPSVDVQGQARAAAPLGDSSNGRKLFVSHGCYQCHGYEAQGSSATGPRLGPRPLAFAQLSKYVRAPTGQMPPYQTDVLADRDLMDIYAFLESRPLPPAVDSIPLLK